MKKSKILFFTICLISLNNIFYSQQTPVYGCATEAILNQSVYGDLPRFSSPLPNTSNCNKTSTSYNDYFKRPDNFMFQNFYRPGVSPSAYYPNRVEPKKTVVINLVFFGEDNGSGYPLQPTPSPDVSPGSDIYLWLNEHNDYTQPSNVAVCHPLSITKTGIEIKVNKVYFYNSSAQLHATQNGSSGNHIVNSQNAMTYHLSHNPDAANQINCIFVQYCGYPLALGFADVFTYQGVSIPFTYSGSNYFNNNYGQSWAAGYSILAQHLPHEIGHHLDMRHPYDSGETNITNYDRLIDLFPCTGVLDTANNNFMAGKGGNHVSPIQSGRMHRALSTDISIWGNSRHYAYGYSEIPYTLETNETWDFTYKSYQDIVIPKGKTLTITCKLEMVPNSKILVEPGGQLIVDGGLITAAKCGGKDYEGYWQGIDVHGDHTKPQSEQYQGKVVLKNGAIIEFAREAIMPWKYSDWTKTGGIIQASNATFRNNKRSIQYMSYQNFISPNAINESSNRGFFKECKFIWDDDAFAGGFQPAITLNGVKGVQIQGCVFQDKRTNIGISDRAVGIYSIDAGYSVGGKFLGNPNSPSQAYYSTTNYVVGEFIDMYKGIEITGSGSYYSNVVDHVKFTNCNYGVFVRGTDNPMITRNEFNYISPMPQGLVAPTEVKVQNSTGFKIEGNHFYNTVGSSIQTYGCIVESAGEAENTVYKNNYDKNYLANQGVSFNRSNVPNQIRGLQYLCNSNLNNRYDLHFQTYQNQNAGVRGNQGLASLASQNTLSSFPTNHIVTTDNMHFMNYYWKGANNEPTSISQPTIGGANAISVYQSPNNHPCPSNFTNVIMHDDDDHKVFKTTFKTSIKDTRDDLAQDKAGIENDYTTFLNNGNASSLYNSISNINLSNRNQVKTDLYAQSPYLSSGVLTNLGAVSTTIFPKSWYLDIIKANIEVFEEPDFRLFLMTKTEPLVGDDMAVLADAYKNYPTSRSVLRNNIADLSDQIATIDNWLLIDELYDEPTDIPSILPNLLSNRADETACIQKLGYYFGLKNWTEYNNELINCQDQLNTMVNSRLRNEIVDVVEILSYLKDNQNSFGSYDLPLSPAQINYLSDFAASKTGKAAKYAANVLCFYANICEEEYRDDPEAGGSKTQKIVFDVVASNASQLKLFPNPTNGQFKVENGNSGIQGVEILNLLGQKIDFNIVSRTENTVEISLGEIKNGVYILQIQDNSGNILVNRFVKN